MLDPLVPINAAQPHGALFFLHGQSACSTLDLKSHPELDRVMFYSVGAVLCRRSGCDPKGRWLCFS